MSPGALIPSEVSAFANELAATDDSTFAAAFRAAWAELDCTEHPAEREAIAA